jgi:hypothetical protein
MGLCTSSSVQPFELPAPERAPPRSLIAESASLPPLASPPPNPPHAPGDPGLSAQLAHELLAALQRANAECDRLRAQVDAARQGAPASPAAPPPPPPQPILHSPPPPPQPATPTPAPAPPLLLHVPDASVASELAEQRARVAALEAQVHAQAAALSGFEALTATLRALLAERAAPQPQPQRPTADASTATDAVPEDAGGDPGVLRKLDALRQYVSALGSASAASPCGSPAHAEWRAALEARRHALSGYLREAGGE